MRSKLRGMYPSPVIKSLTSPQPAAGCFARSVPVLRLSADPWRRRHAAGTSPCPRPRETRRAYPCRCARRTRDAPGAACVFCGAASGCPRSSAAAAGTGNGAQFVPVLAPKQRVQRPQLVGGQHLLGQVDRHVLAFFAWVVRVVWHGLFFMFRSCAPEGVREITVIRALKVLRFLHRRPTSGGPSPQSS